MKDGMTIEFDTDVFDRFARQVGEDMTRRIAGEVLDETAEDVLERARQLTPVRTGKLRSRWKVFSRKVGGKKPFILLGNSSFIARFFEFGTVKLRARPMLTIAFRELQVSGGMARLMKLKLQRSARKRGARGR